MKKILYSLILTFYLNSVFANDSIESPVLESPPTVHLDAPIAHNKYTYFTLGSSVLLQQVGIGRRHRNFETFKGHDFSLNAHFSLLVGMADHEYPVYPSIKYTYLKYKNNTPASPYFGVAYEGVFLIDYRYYRSLSESIAFIPNIGLIWGKERENIRFTQFQLNVIPAAAFVVGIGMALFGSNKGGFLSDRDGGIILTVGSAAVLCSYSAGF